CPGSGWIYNQAIEFRRPDAADEKGVNMVGFIFGGENMPKTPQELARMRAMAEALAPRRTPQNVGEGIASIGNAIAMRLMMNRADKAERAGLEKANIAGDGLIDSLYSDRPSSVADTTTSPPVDALQ